MADELTDLFGHLAAELPHSYDANGDSVTMSAKTLPQPPETLTADSLWMRRVGFHSYNDFPIPGVDLCIDKPSCRNLGLLIFAVLFHPQPTTVEVRLTHPSSQIKKLRVRYEHPGDQTIGLGQTPTQFTYYSDEVSRHPWVRGHTWQEPDPSRLPHVEITTEAEGFVNWEPTQMDTVIGFGNAQGSALLAELLLNASLDSNETHEFNLEGEPGYRGVAAASAELNIFLPGSFGYIS